MQLPGTSGQKQAKLLTVWMLHHPWAGPLLLQLPYCLFFISLQ